jgi:predicted nucleic acid-binding protein
MGLVLDSGVLIAAERDARPVSELLAKLEHEHGEIEIVLSSITVIELEHGLYRAQAATRPGSGESTWIPSSPRSR